MLFTEQIEIEHILPFSKTLDDSMANKTLCTAKANRDKGNRSPFECGLSQRKALDQRVGGCRARSPDTRRRIGSVPLIVTCQLSRPIGPWYNRAANAPVPGANG